MNGKVFRLGGTKSIYNMHWELTLLPINGGKGGGCVFLLQLNEQYFGDYWNSGDSRPIHVMEAQTVANVFVLTVHWSLSLHMQNIQTGCNPADKESRHLSGKDATLMKEKWAMVDDAFGPHSV